MNQKSFKIILVLVVCCAMYGLLFYFLSGANKATEGYILVSELGGLHCKAKICTSAKTEEIPKEKTYKVYQQNKLLGSYLGEYEGKWNFYDKNKWVSIYGDFLGVSDGLNAHIKEFKMEEFTNQDLIAIKDILSKKGIASYERLLASEAVVLDLNNDGKEDRILSVTNQNTEVKENKYFTLLLFIVNGKKIEVYFETSSQKDLPIYNVFSILSLDEEENPRIIINKGYFDQMGSPSILMLQVNGKNIKELVSTSANS